MSEENESQNLSDEAGSEPQVCESCGGSLKKEEINLEEFEGGKLYHMEKIPAYVCMLCGETWIPEETIHEFENMIEIAKSRKKNLKIKPKKKKGS
jgi:YgiT-type zinc finger domain-containing protein